MTAIVFSGIALAALIALALLPALQELRAASDVAPLNVPRDHDNAATRFAASYRARLEQLFDAPLLEALRAEQAAAQAAARRLHWCAAGAESGAVPSPIVGAGDLRLRPGIVQPHEVYAAGDLLLGDGAQARALLADGVLRLGAGSVVERWAHGRDVAFGAGSEVRARVSANRSITLEPGARFVRARAPTISALHMSNRPQKPALPSRSAERHRFAGADGVHYEPAGARWIVAGALRLPPDTELIGDLVVRGDAAFGAGCRVQGSVKVHGQLSVGAGSTIDGACVVIGDCELDANVLLAGPLVGEALVRIGADTVIGRPDAPTSVNGRRISLDAGATVHGSIWAKQAAVAAARA